MERLSCAYRRCNVSPVAGESERRECRRRAPALEQQATRPRETLA